MIIDQNQHEWFWGEILAVENPLDEAWTSTKFAPRDCAGFNEDWMVDWLCICAG